MAPAKKFLFETSFDPEDMAARAAAVPLETHTAAIEEAHSKGFEEGRNEAQEGIDARNTEQLQHLNVKLLTLLEEQEQYRHKVQTLLASILQKSLEKLFPVLAKKQGLSEVLDVVAQTFKKTAPAREITLFTCPQTVDALQEKLKTLQKDFDQPLIFKVCGEETLTYTDCRLEWEGGGVERLSSRLYQEIEACLERLSVTETIDTPPLSQDSSLSPSLEDGLEATSSDTTKNDDAKRIKEPQNE